MSRQISILAPSRERLITAADLDGQLSISILAPSRERLFFNLKCIYNNTHFNPRSLTGATIADQFSMQDIKISILAPSRERR